MKGSHVINEILCEIEHKRTIEHFVDVLPFLTYFKYHSSLS